MASPRLVVVCLSRPLCLDRCRRRWAGLPQLGFGTMDPRASRTGSDIEKLESAVPDSPDQRLAHVDAVWFHKSRVTGALTTLEALAQLGGDRS